MELIVVATRSAVARSALERLAAGVQDSERAALLWLGPPEDDIAVEHSKLHSIRHMRAADHAQVATARVRDWLPEALHHYALASGLMDFYRWRGRVSIWWFMSLSEMSSLRSELIHELYRLALIAEVARTERPSVIYMLVDDALFAAAVADISRTLGIETQVTFQSRHRSGRLTLRDVVHVLPLELYRFVVMPLYLLRSLLLVFIVRCSGLAGYRSEAARAADCWLGFTWFPLHWQMDGVANRMTDRVLGNALESLHHNGQQVVYVATASFGWWTAFKDRRWLRSVLQANRIVLIDGFLRPSDVLRVHVKPAWLAAYRRWRQTRRPVRLTFEGADVTALLLREVDKDVYGFDIQTNVLTAVGSMRLLETLERARGAIHGFEYQPIERAFEVGLREVDGRIPIVGIQTAMASINQMGYLFPSGRTESPPLPDFMVAYSRHIFAALAERLGSNRVRLTGDLRYPYLIPMRSTSDEPGRRREVRERLAGQLGLDNDRVWLLAALPIDSVEASRLLRMIVAATARRNDVAVLFRCHYQNRIEPAIRCSGMRAYAIANGSLPDLLLACRAVITGASSIIVEAIAAGRLPIVYSPSNEYSASPGADLPEAILTFETTQELGVCLDECLSEGSEYLRRREHWPAAADLMLGDGDGQALERFHQFLETCVAATERPKRTYL